MVPVELLIPVIQSLPAWGNSQRTTTVYTVDWRNGFQVKMGWNDNASFHCYLDFGADHEAREAVMQAVFEKHAPAGKKPRRVDGHGYSYLEYMFDSPELITVNEVAEIAEAMGYRFTVLYVQSCSSSRPLFADLGIALVPGEMGKEWKDGAFIPYSTPDGKNL